MQLILMGREQQWLFLDRGARSELALVWGAEYHHLLVHGGSVQQWLLHWGNRGVVAPCRGGHQQLLLGEVGMLITSSGGKVSMALLLGNGSSSFSGVCGTVTAPSGEGQNINGSFFWKMQH